MIITVGERHPSADGSSHFWVSAEDTGMRVESLRSPFWNSLCNVTYCFCSSSPFIIPFTCPLIEVDASLHSLLVEPSPEANPPGVIGSSSVSIACWDHWTVSHVKSSNSPRGATRQLPGQQSQWWIGRGHKQDRLTLPGFASRYTDTNQ